MTQSNPIQEDAPRGLVTAAQVTSDVFSPLLVPTYVMALAMWITPLRYLSEGTRLLSTLTVFVLTTLIPLGVILLLIKLGKVSDRSISHKNERGLPYAVSIFCYALTALYLWYLHAPVWLWAFFAGAGVSSLLAMIITRWWKISAHTTGVGGTIGIFVALIKLHVIGIDSGLLWLSIAILLTGWMGTSRLILHRHTPAQVYGGMVMGAVVEYFTVVGLSALL